MKKIKAGPLAVSIAIALGTGAVSSFISRDAMQAFSSVRQPPLSPPMWLFPVVWTILYILMGISAYLVYTSDSVLKRRALIVYALQLAVNFAWTPLFFNAKAYLAAFMLLLLLIILVSAMITLFGKINPLSAKLQIPYIIWLIFAAYLNFGVYWLNT